MLWIERKKQTNRKNIRGIIIDIFKDVDANGPLFFHVCQARPGVWDELGTPNPIATVSYTWSVATVSLWLQSAVCDMIISYRSDCEELSRLFCICNTCREWWKGGLMAPMNSGTRMDIIMRYYYSCSCRFIYLSRVATIKHPWTLYRAHPIHGFCSSNILSMIRDQRRTMGCSYLTNLRTLGDIAVAVSTFVRLSEWSLLDAAPTL